MKIKNYLLIFFIITNLFSQESVSFVYINEGSKDLKINNSYETIKLFLEDRLQKAQISADITLNLPLEEAKSAFIKKLIDYLTIDTYFYIQNFDQFKPSTKSIWLASTIKGDVFERYYILTLANSQINSINQLSGKKVAMREGNYFANLYFQNKLSTLKKPIKYSLSTVENDGTALINTYFKKYDACVIPQSTYETMIELNPAIKKKLKIIDQSPKIFNRFSILRSYKSNHHEQKKFESGLINYQKSTLRKEMIELAGIQTIREVELSELEPLNQYYQEYLKRRVTHE